MEEKRCEKGDLKAQGREGSEIVTVGMEEMDVGEAGEGPRWTIGMSSDERRRIRRRR